MSGLRKVLAGAAVMALAAGFAPGAAAVSPQEDAWFVEFVQGANDFEVAVAEMALAKSSDAAIRSYAGRVIAESSDARRRLSQARRAAGVAFGLTSIHGRIRQATRDRLSVLEGARFDDAYADAQLASRRDDLKQVGAYARDSGNADLRRFAQDLLPRLQDQLERAERIARQ